jgi:hypothetical protein
MSDMSETENVREERLRRAAQRQGLLLVKSRGSGAKTFDLGTYVLVDAATNTLVAGDDETGYGHDLNNVESYLNRGLS